MTIIEVHRNVIASPPSDWPRWRMEGTEIVVGDNVTSAADWQHLRKDFNLAVCLNVDGGHSDAAHVSLGDLYEVQALDDGAGLSSLHLDRAREAYEDARRRGSGIYVHCHLGRSRSPAFAYALLRAVGGMSALQAKELLDESTPHGPYGEKWGHLAYLMAADRWAEGGA